MTNLKRKVCDKIFGALGYHYLLLRYVTHMEEQRCAKTRLVIVAKSKHLFKLHDGTLNFSHWMRTSVSQLVRACLESSLLFHDNPASTDVLSMFGHVIAVDVLYE